VSAIDDRIDDLYKLPLADFTSARNALAKTLKGSDDAGRVKALKKPTVVPWAINQLYWRARKTYDRLLDRGAKLRKAQIAALSGKGDGDGLREATDAHRAALTEAVREAGRLAAGGAQHADPLTRTLEALSLASEPPEQPGRLTGELQPAGFEALAGVKPTASLREVRSTDPRSVRLQPDPPREDPREIARREAEEKKHQEQIAAAEAALERARDAVAFAKQTLERATRAYDEAEARLKRTRDRS
jgi:hypothetical protein